MLALGFYLVAAHSFSVSTFGVIRYTITLALLALAPLLVLATATNRELGAARAGEEQTRVVLGSSLAIALWVWLATVVLCIAANGLGLTGNADLTGLIVVLAGLATFNLYYQVSRGLGLIRRIAITYVGGSVLQLVLLIVARHADRPERHRRPDHLRGELDSRDRDLRGGRPGDPRPRGPFRAPGRQRPVADRGAIDRHAGGLHHLVLGRPDLG